VRGKEKFLERSIYSHHFIRKYPEIYTLLYRIDLSIIMFINNSRITVITYGCGQTQIPEFCPVPADISRPKVFETFVFIDSCFSFKMGAYSGCSIFLYLHLLIFLITLFMNTLQLKKLMGNFIQEDAHSQKKNVTGWTC